MERHRSRDSASSEPDTKRRKLRKGTTSCWDCKKRKVKCTFDATSDTICIACRNRGAPCIGQDHPEEEFHFHADSKRDPLVERVQRVESLLEQLIELGHRVERDIGSSGSGLRPQRESGYFTPTSDHSPRGTSGSFNLAPKLNVPTRSVVRSETDEQRKLSEELLKVFPAQDEVNAFCKSDYIATFYCHQFFTNSGAPRPEHEAFDFVNDLATIPDPSTHPVLIANRMIILALFLQYFKSQNWHSLPENPHTVMERLVETAMRFVTSNEKVVCCIEGLECVMLEALYHVKGGNLRRSWLAFRKAMVVAQLMKLDLPNPPPVKALGSGVEANPRFLWFRIVYMDAMLSLMLGLPHGGQDVNMECDLTGATPSCQLEKVHTLVARRIIDRNRRNTLYDDLDTTRELDQQLLKASRAVPDSFWAPANFTGILPNTRKSFWEIMRLCDQVHHYNLVHLLHLPYLLRPDKENSYNTYAKITCVTASRALLSRFVTFRHFNFNASNVYCRSTDFLALMASMTIILAHIDSHKNNVDDWRAHQRIGDRAMVEELLHMLEEVEKRTDDNLTRKSAEQLRCLLDIESDAARGLDHDAQSTVSRLEESSGDLQLHIPYFGIIKIGREGITKNGPVNSITTQPFSAEIPDSVHVANYMFTTAGFSGALHDETQPLCFQRISDGQATRAPQIPLVNVNPNNELHEQQQMQSPCLMAGVDDWAFQGVDAAFFDSVMKGTVDWEQPLHDQL